MSQHPYARTLSPIPNPSHNLRATSSHNNAPKSRKPRHDKLPTKPSASMVELRTPGSLAMSMIGPQHRRHFVKQENSATLVLSGHSGMEHSPVYTSGSFVRGLVTLSYPKNILSVVVNLEGTLKLRELQGGGVSISSFLSETLYTWNGSPSCTSAPSEFNFETMIPIFLPPAGDRRLLPPSYDSRVGAMASASVQYEFVVSVTRHAGPMEFWKKRTRLRVPFILKPLTRPQAAGPFPASVSRHSSERPQTIFLDAIQPRHPSLPPIEVQLFLPQSQVIPSTERISFRLALRAPNSYLDQILAASAAAQPLASFLPIPSLYPDATCSFDTASDLAPSLKFKSIRQPRFALRLLESSQVRQPVNVRLERRVILDPRDSSGSVLPWGRSRRTTATEVLAVARLHREKLEDGRVKWWGHIDVPANAECSGFVADRLSVQDFISIDIQVPEMHTHENPYKNSIPVRLTSHSARAVTAIKVGQPEVWR